MKATLITLTSIAASFASAAVVIQEPWASSNTWTSGNKAMITWSVDAADANKLCDIQMLGGDTKDANVVAYVTNPSTPIKCSEGKFEITPLNDFTKGKYWLRIGQEKTGTWYYSGIFEFDGKGSATPLKLADGTPLKPDTPEEKLKEQPKDQQPNKDQPKDQQPNKEQLKDQQPNKDQPKDQQPNKDQPKDQQKPKDGNQQVQNPNAPKASGSAGSVVSGKPSNASSKASASASVANARPSSSTSTNNNNKVQDPKKTNSGYQVTSNQFYLVGLASMVGYALVL